MGDFNSGPYAGSPWTLSLQWYIKCTYYILIFSFLFGFVLFCFWYRVWLWWPDWPRIHYVGQNGLRLTKIPLPLPSELWNYFFENFMYEYCIYIISVPSNSFYVLLASSPLIIIVTCMHLCVSMCIYTCAHTTCWIHFLSFVRVCVRGWSLGVCPWWELILPCLALVNELPVALYLGLESCCCHVYCYVDLVYDHIIEISWALFPCHM